MDLISRKSLVLGDRADVHMLTRGLHQVIKAARYDVSLRIAVETTPIGPSFSILKAKSSIAGCGG